MPVFSFLGCDESRRTPISDMLQLQLINLTDMENNQGHIRSEKLWQNCQ